MARTIISVIVGYFAMLVLAFVGFTCAYLIVGQDVAFKPGLYEASSPWVAIAFVINIVVSVVGGLICARIASFISERNQDTEPRQVGVATGQLTHLGNSPARVQTPPRCFPMMWKPFRFR